MGTVIIPADGAGKQAQGSSLTGLKSHPWEVAEPGLTSVPRHITPDTGLHLGISETAAGPEAVTKELPLHVCENSVVSICVDFFWTLFYSTDLFVSFDANTTQC